jgi:2-octaprenylphenol hydroxylase
MIIWMHVMTRFAVYGGGPVAMLLALMLQKQGLKTELWRPYFKPAQARSRVFALNARALKFLKDLGIKVDEYHPIRSMQIWDAKTFAQLGFSAAGIGKAALAYTIDEAYLWAVMMHALQENDIKIYDLAADESCRLSKGTWFVTGSRADFLCIADGANSKLRTELAVPCDQGSYHQEALVALVRVSQPQPQIAFQSFGAHGPLAFLPMGDNLYSIVWSQDLHEAKRLKSLSPDALAQELGKAMDQHLGEIISIEELRSYPLYWLHAKSYYGANWLLAGDSAHHFHPLAGLGLNMGIGDIISLSEIIEERGFSPLSLGYYQRARKAQISPIIWGMQFLKNCFGIQENFWVKCRSFGMDFLDHQEMAKKIMMRIMQEL